MKLNTSKSSVTTSGSLDVTQATIELNSTTIHVLSRDLYSKPVHAVLREILTNAIDAHIEANVVVPVHVKLPTTWDEQFYIRDFGNGLSHDELKGIYLAYGKSTRRDSDTVHGGFGLGTKSPLAYTTAFAVTSYQNGMANEYLVYYDQDNLPCLDHKSMTETYEPNGLKVSLSTVSSNDYLQFREAAQVILPRIPPDKYTLIESDVNAWAPNGFALPVGHEYGNMVLRADKGNAILVVMGCVAYSINSEAVVNYLDNLGSQGLSFSLGNSSIKASQVITSLLRNCSLEIYANIGDYPIHPSREYINVTPRAVKKLCADIQKGLEQMFDLAQTQEPDLTKDVMYFNVVGNMHLLPNCAAPIRVRFLLPSFYSYSSPRIPRLIHSYGELVETIAEQKKSFVVVPLATDDFTDYLGNGRATYRYPKDIDKNNAILFYDKDHAKSDVFNKALRSIPASDIIDLSADVAAYKLQVETERVNSPSVPSWNTRRIRSAPVKSMQDPKHNVLVFKSNQGTRKADWNSAQHNVLSLKAYKRPVFWVHTRMGCIVDPHDNKQYIERYNDTKDFLPERHRPIIIGLPASKGTLAFEREFKPLKEFAAYIDNFLASDYAQRRMKIRRTCETIDDALRTTSLPMLADYGPIDYVNRFMGLRSKYNINQIRFYNDVTGHDISDILQSIKLKFPILAAGSYYWRHSEDVALFKDWAIQVAEYTGEKPTSARYKNAIRLNTQQLDTEE